jgi:hypothetical protein
MYLIYATEQDAWERSEQEGIEIGLAHHTAGRGSRYVTAPQETADGQWALDVESYQLDEIEETSLVDTFTPKTTIDEA